MTPRSELPYSRYNLSYILAWQNRQAEKTVPRIATVQSTWARVDYLYWNKPTAVYTLPSIIRRNCYSGFASLLYAFFFLSAKLVETILG